jgi:threonine dehydrogenase-like Zn-dependent dehydrogenase
VASKGGTVVVVGVPTGDVSIPLAVVQDHQIRIQGSATYLPSDFARSIDILCAGGVRVADFITAQLPLDRAREGFALSGRGDHVKVVLTRFAASGLAD